MKNNLAFIQDGLVNHPAEALFNISVKNYKRSSMAFGFTVRDKFLNSFCDSAGACSLLIDYAARKAGFEAIGGCFIYESETIIHSRTIMKEITVTVSIESHNSLDASYYCQIFSSAKTGGTPIAESQGALVRNSC